MECHKFLEHCEHLLIVISESSRGWENYFPSIVGVTKIYPSEGHRPLPETFDPAKKHADPQKSYESAEKLHKKHYEIQGFAMFMFPFFWWVG